MAGSTGGRSASRSGKRPAAKPQSRSTTATKTTASKGATTRGKTKAKVKAKGKQKATPWRNKTTKQKVLTVALWVMIVVAFLSLVGVIAAIIAYNSIDIPDPNEDFTTANTRIYYNDATTELGTLAMQNRTPLSYQEMPESIINAVLAAEDRTFWTNPGISIPGMIRAGFNIIAGGELQSGSTITQQYIKLMYLTDEQTLTRKLKELIIAVKLNEEMPKEEILEGYLNTIWFGRGSYGIQEAARAYFGIDAAQLTVPQAAALAAILNSPGLWDPGIEGNEDGFLKRYEYVLDGMLTMGNLTETEYKYYLAHPPEFPHIPIHDTYGGPGGYLIKMVEAQLAEMGYPEEQIQGGGLSVITTIDHSLQWAMESTVQDYVAQIVGARPDVDISQLHIGMASVEVGTGRILALYGGPDFVSQQRNWATTPRMAGSTFKPYAFIAGERHGFSLKSLLRGDSFTPQGDSVSVDNFAGTNYGLVTLEYALPESINTAFVDLVLRTPNGPEEVARAANDAGVPTGAGWDLHSRITLGSGEISPLDQATGYATIANYGRYAAPYLIQEVRTASGEVLYRATPEITQTIEADICRDLAYAMQETVRMNSYAERVGHYAAAKSGTAEAEGEVKAAWYVGFTKQISTAVMFVAGPEGYSSLYPYRPSGWGFFTGGSWPVRVWGTYMKLANEELPNLKFDPPPNVNGSGQEWNPITPSPTPTPTPTPSPTPPTVPPDDPSGTDPPETDPDETDPTAEESDTP
ncbi:MAG: penicillin-binding protein [Propionibacteriaceae bacterium]|jgi:membrane peptidoglycan carboxypeptidase|nr:penicillin-binding protein [Propionibacteriaceae bacterium]